MESACFVLFYDWSYVTYKTSDYSIIFNYDGLGLLNSLLSLIFVFVAGGISFAIFLFYGFFRTLSKDLEQAARIDGCNDFQIYYKIVLPLMKPPIAIVGIVHLVNVWNDFFYSLIFIRSEELRTIPLGMLTLFGEYDTEWNLLFAGLTISSLPLLIAFLFASRTFIEGLTSGAVKSCRNIGLLLI
ncbi:binding-protein-dependent transport system inner membrane component [Bacillus oleivorans]|uniref:Binding-protein-dependent transport system inner membrane component n=1 Tax=Bacillus oleivorans TaxID=1448271 RepID=A0A285CNX3_9BACI|nr:carbohydrate ABC transporter permease [Bacillus oleivorans]SNX68756.1 binding-protein-dependent transport system inner membrane component [Bacillus oleivorans]